MAMELHLDPKTVKSLEKQYMRKRFIRAGLPAPRVIGIDEISMRKAHTYRMMVMSLPKSMTAIGAGSSFHC
jgi:transposase